VRLPPASFANVMSCVALFVALGGASYAAVTLPRNSVGAKQIVAGAIDNSKIKQGSLLRSAFKPGQLPAGKTGAKGPAGPQGAQAAAGAQGPPGATGAAGGSVTQLAGMSSFSGQTISADGQWHTWVSVTFSAVADTIYELHYDDDYSLFALSGASCAGSPDYVQRGLTNGVVSGTADAYGNFSIPTFYGPYASGTQVTVQNQYQQICATETLHLPPGQILAVPYRTP
jgi:hypothetical protein